MTKNLAGATNQGGRLLRSKESRSRCADGDGCSIARGNDVLQFDPSRVSLDEAWSMCAVGTVEELVGTEGGTGTEEGREAGREGEGDTR